MSRQLWTYALASMSYGFGRKAIMMKDAHVKQYNYTTYKYNTVPVLNVDKVWIVGLSTLCVATLAPLYIVKDLRQIEARSRGIEKHYGFGEDEYSSLLDCVFS